MKFSKIILVVLIFIIILSTGCANNNSLNNSLPSTPTPGLPESTSTPTIPVVTNTPQISFTLELNEAENAILYGDYQNANELYKEAFATALDERSQITSLYGIGKTYYLLEDYSDAIDTFTKIIERYPDNNIITTNTFYYLGMSYKNTDSVIEAINSFSQYLNRKPSYLVDHIQEIRGDLLLEIEDEPAAIIAYENAIQSAQLSNLDTLNSKIGIAYQLMGDHQNAIRVFMELYETTENDYIKAQMDRLAGESYLAIDLPDQAYARFQDAVENYPLSYDSYLCLVKLIDDEIPVSELSRGIVDYYAGQYGYAIDALEKYIANKIDHDGTPHHYLALSYRKIGDPKNAIDEWKYLIDNYAGNRFWIDAWDEIIYTQWAFLENYKLAAETALDFVKRYPAEDAAPDYLYKAARNFERNNDLDLAASTWERLIDEYPSADISYRALFLAGITYYRINEFVKSQNAFQRVLVLGVEPSEISSSYFWIGKTQFEQGQFDEAISSWELAEQKDPNGYYSLRSKELILNIAPFSEEIKYDFNYDLDYERGLADSWMRNTFDISDEIELLSNDLIKNDINYLRGNEFWELSEFSLAANEFDFLRKKFENDPAGSFQLLEHFTNIGLYRPAIYTSHQILDLSVQDNENGFSAPLYFNHIRYGTYYSDLVLDSAYIEGFDAALIYSLIRTESLFEGFIRSSAGAQGLMQIMPLTAQEVTDQLNWPQGFTTEDLNRPYINITIGTNYLSRQRDYFDNDIFAALAAYNGGPGNTSAWIELSNNDPDLFLEIIRIDETRNYIKSIFENYYAYKRLYEIPQ